MSIDGRTIADAEPPHLEIYHYRLRRRRRKGPWVPMVALAAVVAFLWVAGYRPEWLGPRKQAPTTLAVDRGEVRVVVVENGTFESARSESVKCQVEALMGAVAAAGSQAPAAGGGRNRAGGGGNARAGGTIATTPNAGGVAQPTTPAPAQQGANQAAGGAAKKARFGAARTGAAKKTTTGPNGMTGAQAAAAAGAPATPAGGMAGGGGGGIARPALKSFTMTVPPHTPLRPTATTQATTATARVVQPAMMSGGGGGGGGRGGGPNQQQRTGSTTILRILPEGSWVKQGEVVCELDSAAFRDELLAELIRWDQAKSWVEQARSALRVAEISLKEYRDGVLPQDRHLLEGYLQQLRNDREQKQLSLEFARVVAGRGLMTPNQLKGTEFALEQADIVMGEALGMKERLERFTAPRLIKNLEAKIAAVRADLLAQEAAFVLEDARKRRLEKNIEACTLRAPRDGFIVYAEPAGQRGQPGAEIQEGLPVRQGQEIFRLPDPRLMRIRANINESRVAMVYSGQAAEIHIDAFPEVTLTGKVAEVTPIPAPAAGPISDVKRYYAVVNLDGGGFEGLRHGLSAEIALAVASHRDVTRVPVRAIRWLDGAPYVALPTPEGGHAWRRLELGLTSPIHAEVRAGLEPGERVLADPESLPRPAPLPPPAERRAVASDAAKGRG
jgi:HlyD family secretion protein